jgi:hypothetical protein
MADKRREVRERRVALATFDTGGGYWLVCERRFWDDGSSCLHVAKWGTQPGTGRPAPFYPPQYLQLPWSVALFVVFSLACRVRAAGVGEGGEYDV